MKIRIKPDKEVKGGYYRFDIVLESDQNLPLLVIRGWRLANWQHIMSPQSFSRKGLMFNVCELPDEAFKEQVLQSLLKKIDPDETKRMQAKEGDNEETRTKTE